MLDKQEVNFGFEGLYRFHRRSGSMMAEGLRPLRQVE